MELRPYSVVSAIRSGRTSSYQTCFMSWHSCSNASAAVFLVLGLSEESLDLLNRAAPISIPDAFISQSPK